MSTATTERPISPPRVARRGTGTTRYEKEIATTPKLADDPDERKWVGPWLLGETVGKGASGRVRLAKHKRTHKVAAIKIIPKLHLGRSDPKAERVMQSIRREMVVMKLIHHPHIMDMYDVYEDKDDLYLLLEYVEGGELFDYLVSKGRLELSEAISYFRQIIAGVHYCHQFNIAHRDLKPENLLLDKDKNIKIADFGMAALEYNGTAFLETSCGSPHYASPEVVAGKQYHGSASDIWSCGVVLFALLTGRLPFDHENMGELLRRVKAGKFEMPRSIPPEAKDLLSRILRVDPAQRIKMEEIIRHPFFNLSANISNTQILNAEIPIGPGLVIPSKEHIDQPILENLVALFRKQTKAEITAKLLEPKGGWEKSFYFLLKNYQDRQSEDYGHGMNFVDYTGREEPDVTKMHRKRLSITATSTVPLKGGPPRETTKPLTSSQQPRAPPLHRQDSSTTSTPRAATDTRRTENTPPSATRTPAAQDHPSRRRRPALSGPRPHTSYQESGGSDSVGSNSPSSSPEKKAAKDENAVAPARPDRNTARTTPTTAVVPPTPERASAGESLPAQERPTRGRAYTLGAEVASPQPTSNAARMAASTPRPVSPLDQIAASRTSQSDKPRARDFTSPGPSAYRSPNASTAAPGSPTKAKSRTASAVIGLGLELPAPPPIAESASPRRHSRTPTNEQARLSPAEHPAASPRPIPSPRADMVPPPASPRASHRLSVDADAMARQMQATELSSPKRRPPSLKLNTNSELLRASYPSPPPSNNGSLEPLLALQQSPVFSERFSLHLDAMLVKPPMKSPVPMELDDTEEEDESAESDELTVGEAMDLDDRTPMQAMYPSAVTSIPTPVSANDDRTPVQAMYPSAISGPPTPVPTSAPTPAYARRLSEVEMPPPAQVPGVSVGRSVIEPRARADTSMTLGPGMAGGDWSFLGAEADEARRAVPYDAAQELKKPARVAAIPMTNRAAPPAPMRQRQSQNGGGGESDVEGLIDGAGPARSMDRHVSRKVRSSVAKTRARRSTFVAAPPSPALTPTLEPVQSGWFAQFFRVKPAAYSFNSLESFVNTRSECAALLRSFGVQVEEVKHEGKYGMLRCHVDYVQEDTGNMIVNKPCTFRAQITPHFTVRSPNMHRGSDASIQGFTLTSENASSTGSRLQQQQTPNPNMTINMPAPPAETCTLSLIQEHGAKSTLEVIALRFRQEWRLDTTMLDGTTIGTPATPRSLF